MNYTKEAKKYIEQFNYPLCERCGGNQRLSIHQLVYRSEAPKHENLHNPRNFILVCQTDHNWFHDKKSNRNQIVKERKLWELFPELLYLRE